MAVAMNVADRETVAAYVRELEAKGFIKATRRGGFSVKVSDRRATEWALTWLKIADELPDIHNYHFREEVVDGEMVFDYILRSGPCPTTNALKIMQMEGLPI